MMNESVGHYKKVTSMAYRKKFGQFFTPKKVAELMAEWVTQENPVKILDPSYGLGIFSDSVEKIYGHGHRFFGVEVDDKILNFSKAKAKNVTIKNYNYLKWKTPTKFDAIICNPPYSRFQNHSERHDIIPNLENFFNTKLSGHTNIASLFLLKSIHELEKNGAMAYIMPYEFFNTGYGEYVKGSLVKNNLLKHIIIFENEKDIFDDVITTIAVLLIKNNNAPSDVGITKISTNQELNSLNSFQDKTDCKIPISKLDPREKWTMIIDSQYSDVEIDPSFIPLNTLGRFTRGIATGANNFFSLNKEKIASLKIPEENFKKCITKSPQVRNFILDEKIFKNLLERNDFVFCLDVFNPRDSYTKKYISEGEQQKINLRYLTKVRNPWFKIEKRLPAPILAGVFNRGRLKFVRNFTDAINFTCFHSFYPNELGKKYLNQLYLYLISDFGQKILKLSKRNYGAGLDKFEPNDLNKAFIPSIEQLESIENKTALKIIKELDSNTAKSLKKINQLFH